MTLRELSPGVLRATRSPWWFAVSALFLAVGAFFFFVGAPWTHIMPPYHIDFDVYRMGGEVFLRGGDIYGELPTLHHGERLPFTYPPVSAVLFSLFAVLPLDVGSFLLTAGTVACLWYVLVVAARFTWNIGVGTALRLTLPVLGLGLWLGPVRETLFFGQINVLLMAAIVAGLVAGLGPLGGRAATRDGVPGGGAVSGAAPPRGRLWGAVLVGLVASIKLTPLVFGLFYLARRDLRGAFGVVGGFVLGGAIGAAFLPHSSVQYWTSTIRSSDRIGSPMFASNQSLNGELHRLLGGGTASQVIWAVLVVAVIAVIAWSAHALERDGRPLEAAMAVALVSLLASPVSWGHHWVWVAPMAVLLAARAFPGLSARSEPAGAGTDAVLTGPDDPGGVRRWPAAVLALGLLVAYATPYWLVPRGGDRESGWSLADHLLGNGLLWWGVLAVVFFLTAGLSSARRRTLEARRFGNAPS